MLKTAIQHKKVHKFLCFFLALYIKFYVSLQYQILTKANVMKKNEPTKKPIAPLLKKMEIGDIEEWNRPRSFTVINAIQRMHIESAGAVRFKTRANFTTIQVKRVK